MQPLVRSASWCASVRTLLLQLVLLLVAHAPCAYGVSFLSAQPPPTLSMVYGQGGTRCMLDASSRSITSIGPGEITLARFNCSNQPVVILSLANNSLATLPLGFLNGARRAAGGGWARG